MKVVIQRVNKSSVEINNKIKSEIQKGLLVLIGIGLDAVSYTHLTLPTILLV